MLRCKMCAVFRIHLPDMHHSIGVIPQSKTTATDETALA